VSYFYSSKHNGFRRSPSAVVDFASLPRNRQVYKGLHGDGRLHCSWLDILSFHESKSRPLLNSLLGKCFEVPLEQWYPLSVVGWIESSLCCLVSVLSGTSLRYVRLNDYFAYIFSKLKLISPSMQSLDHIVGHHRPSSPFLYATLSRYGTHFATWVFAPVLGPVATWFIQLLLCEKLIFVQTNYFLQFFIFYDISLCKFFSK
jgi:hypothetical protein